MADGGLKIRGGFNESTRNHLDRQRAEVDTFADLAELTERVPNGHITYVKDEELHYKLRNDLSTWVPFGEGAEASDPTVLKFVATNAIIGGRLIARMAAGLVPYDANNLAMRHALLGVALDSANPGQVFRVQLSGLVTYPGWGLTPDVSYKAGPLGQLTTAGGFSFVQIVGRATSADTLLFNPQLIIQL